MAARRGDERSLTASTCPAVPRGTRLREAGRRLREEKVMSAAART
ncbi:hypothetical protein [Pyxidicoccus xibeiensis]|nr:hypothetical protein [Pyxidicoccus xibeiensis]